MSLDLRELELRVLGVHLFDLLYRWGSKDLYNLDELVGGRFPWKERLSEHHFSQQTPHRPDIDGTAVVGGAENQLGSSVVPGADIGDVRLPWKINTEYSKLGLPFTSFLADPKSQTFRM